MNFQKVCICKEQHLISQKLLLSAAALLSTWLWAWLQQVPFPTETNGIVLSGSRNILLERVMNIGKQHQGNTGLLQHYELTSHPAELHSCSTVGV